MDMNRIIGSALAGAYPGKRVQMKDPDVTVGVEVVQNAAYVYARSLPGVGGLPVGSSGTVACLLSSGIDSPVACGGSPAAARCAWACTSPGGRQTSDASEFLVDDIARVLERTGCIARVHTVPFGGLPARDRAFGAPLRCASSCTDASCSRWPSGSPSSRGAGALVTGESLGQVALPDARQHPLHRRGGGDAGVFRPLIGTDKLEIIGEAERLGTFEISSQDAPDCCTLFMPRAPETHAKLPVVLEAEGSAARGTVGGGVGRGRGGSRLRLPRLQAEEGAALGDIVSDRSL